jgi:hypothetical protein
LTFAAATAVAFAVNAESAGKRPPMYARTYATNKAPTKLNNQLNTQFYASPPTDA